MPLFRKLDYEVHFWTGVLISFSSIAILNWGFSVGLLSSSAIAFVIGSLAGIGKELYDKKIKKTKFDFPDLWSTVKGSLFISLFFALLGLLENLSK